MSEKRLKKIPTLEEKWKLGKTSEQAGVVLQKRRRNHKLVLYLFNRYNGFRFSAQLSRNY